MVISPKDQVAFDILLHSQASGRPPSVATISEHKPLPEDIEKCRRFLISKGIEAHATEFGLACKAQAELFEKLFNVTLKPLKPQPGTPHFKMLGPPNPPSEIAEAIEEITITAPPEFF